MSKKRMWADMVIQIKEVKLKKRNSDGSKGRARETRKNKRG